MNKDKVTITSTRQFFDNQIWFISDVMAFTGYSKQTIYNLVSLKKIPFIKKRNKLVFIPKEIQNWMLNGE